MSQLRYKYLALGDSYTAGEGLSSDQSFPQQLVRIMNSSGCSIDDPVVIAKTGWTTSELMDGITESGVDASFDLVTLLIGVNNQYRGLSLEEYQSEFSTLLELAVTFAGNNRSAVYVLSIPDWSATPFAADRDRAEISLAIDRFNAINRDITEAARISYIDITKGSRKSPDDPSMIAGDNLHPSASEYHRWARELALCNKEKRVVILR